MNFLYLIFSYDKSKKKRKKIIHLSINTEKSCPKYMKFGLESLNVLSKNINNRRYLGFSQFQSSNTLQNSSYIWSFPKTQRTRRKDYMKYNDNIYNIPDFKTTRTTNLGYGIRKIFNNIKRKDEPSPASYTIKSLFEYNLDKKKGPIMTNKPKFSWKNNRYSPGPGTYNISSRKHFGLIPITIKSRVNDFYDEILKQKKFIVIKQLYLPNFKLVEQNRFSGITFGIGDRPKLYCDNKFPGPGTYNVPGCFDRGLKGKLPLN